MHELLRNIWIQTLTCKILRSQHHKFHDNHLYYFQKNTLMWCTPKVKATFGVLFMTKISKQIKPQAIQEYVSGKYTMRGIISRYGIAKNVFRMLIAAYKSFGPDILFNPPTITPEFRIKVTSWAIQNNASHSQVAAKFVYTGIAQIVSWKKVYSQLGPNGLLSIQKGRPPDDYKGQKIQFTGKVVQVMEDDSETQVRLAVNGDIDNIILVGIDPDILNGSRILEDDLITVSGLSIGTVSYKSTLGGKITIPAMLAKIINDQGK